MPTHVNGAALRGRNSGGDVILPALSSSDSEFEDSHIETPQALRNTSKSFTETYARTTTVPLRKDLSAPTNLSTPTRIRKLLVSFSDEERQLIRTEKLISDHNVFSPQKQAGSPPRRIQNAVHRNSAGISALNRPSLERDIEFDPSDRDLPEKGANALNGAVVTEDYKQTVTRTPRRLSPLRKEIVASSSSSKSVAENIDQIARSGATRSKSTQEILDQINSSIDRMREVEGEPRKEDSDSDSDEGILRKLDSFLPKATSAVETPSRSSKEYTKSPLWNLPEISFPKTSGPGPVDGKADVVQPAESVLTGNINNYDANRIKDSFPSSLTRSQKVLSPVEARKLKRSKASRKSVGSLSGMYARNVLRKRKQGTAEYESWLYEKWDKLKRLVELSVPRNVLVNNSLVLKELGCDKAELQQRIQFLERQRH